MNKLLVASEYTEPSFHMLRILKALEDSKKLAIRCGLLLITKNISGSLPIWVKARELDIPTVFHATITGLGGTTLEPSVPDWKKSCEGLTLLMERVKDPRTVVLRIDPLIPEVTVDFSVIDTIVGHAFELGITRVRTSVIDYYPFVRKKFKTYSIPLAGTGFQPDFLDKYNLLKTLAELVVGKYGMSLEACAEDIEIPGMTKVGCANREEWKSLGLDLPLGSPKRWSCFCNTPKYDLLPKETTCRYNCLYCYWGRNR